MPISLTLLARITGQLTAAPDAGTANVAIAESLSIDLADGTAAYQANAIYVDAFTLAGSGTTNIDLAGSLTDPLNQALVFSAVKALLIEADPANTTDLVVGNGANPFVGPFGAGAQTLTVKPGGCIMLVNPSAAGWPVVAGTGDILQIANGAGLAANGRITVIGER